MKSIDFPLNIYVLRQQLRVLKYFTDYYGFINEGEVELGVKTEFL